MKSIFTTLALFTAVALSQNVSTRLPEITSWQVLYQYNKPLMTYLDELALEPIKPDAKPKDITGALNSAISKEKVEAGKGKLLGKEVSKNKIHYYEIISTEGSSKQKQRFTINKNYVFTKKSNFPRFIANGRNGFADSSYTAVSYTHLTLPTTSRV